MPSQNLKINFLGVQRLKRGCAQSQSNSPANTETTTNETNNIATQGQMTDPEHSVERVETVVFSDEGPSTTGDHFEPSQLPEQMGTSATDKLSNDVLSFLKRPIMYETVDWLATQTAGSLLTEIRLPRKWIAKKMILEKLQGFRYLKTDFKYTVQVNAQPFNAGMLLIIYEPCYDSLTQRPSSVHHLGGLTGYRHVILDLATATSASLQVPFHPLISHYDLVNAYGTAGRVGVYVYSPLTGLADVDFTVWVAAENIEVQMPTGLPVASETPTVFRGTAQAGGMQAEKKRPGNVETISKTVGSVAKMASGIPGIGAVATATSAIADAVGGVASMFGWSKPTDPEFPTKVEIGYGKYTANYNGDAKTKGLGFDARNAVQTATQTANVDEDEMALKTITSRPVYYTRFGMNKTQLPGTVLFKTPVCPTACEKENVTNATLTGVVFNNTFLSYLSNLFIAYRGGLKYTFRVVKTSFHSGRICLMWVPGAVLDTTFGDIDQSKCYRVIYDLRETSEIEFEVPYINYTPFKTIRSHVSLINPTALAYTRPTGMLYVFVVNGLRNPTTCADNIDVIVEVCGADDFQFAGPYKNDQALIGNDQPNVIIRANEIVGPVTYGIAQMDLVPMGNTSTAIDEQGVGEVVESLRAILKRYTNSLRATTNPQFCYHPSWELGVPTLAGLLTQNADYWTWISQLYRFMSGGMRLGIVRGTDHEYNVRYTTTAFGLGAKIQDSHALTTTQRGNAYQFQNVEPWVELGIPFYQQTPAILTFTGEPILNGPNDDDVILGGYNHMPSNFGTALEMYNADTGAKLTDADLATTTILRSIGEDFSFFYLLGPPRTGRFRPPPP